jgi:hypothetical protein
MRPLQCRNPDKKLVDELSEGTRLTLAPANDRLNAIASNRRVKGWRSIQVGIEDHVVGGLCSVKCGGRMERR